jgi:hypothetical protein
VTRQRERERPRGKAPFRDGPEDTGELPLAQTLAALHRSERAPRAVLKQVQERLANESERAAGSSWARWLEGLMLQIAGWPLAAVVAALLMSFVTWQRQQTEAARREAELGAAEVAVTGRVVRGSLQFRIYGDEAGMGLCEGHFLLAPEDAPYAAPVRVRWTRCDLPDALSDELRHPFSPVHGAPRLSVRVHGHWARANEFEALGLRLQP